MATVFHFPGKETWSISENSISYASHIIPFEQIKDFYLRKIPSDDGFGIIVLVSDKKYYLYFLPQHAPAAQNALQKIESSVSSECLKTIERRNLLFQHMIMTTTPMIDGYRIVRYIDLVCAEVVIPCGLLGKLTDNTFSYVDSMEKARRLALREIRLKAAEINSNAVVGIDIDISNLGGGLIAVASGTAVVIQKSE